MTDHDRGAYTPQNDAPLSFDARRSRGRGVFPTTLLLSLAILIGMGGAIYMVYRSGVRAAGEAPVPVGSPVGEIKSPPPAGAQTPKEAGQGLVIYKSEGGAAASSAAPVTFAPPPEQPQPRPTTPVAAQPIAPPQAAPKPPAPAAQTALATPAAPASAPPPAPAKAAVAADKPAVKDEVGALLDAKPAKAEARKAEAPKPADVAKTAPPAAAPVGAAVQFGAFSSEAVAATEWKKLAKAYPSDLAGKGDLIEPVERNGKTLYRAAAVFDAKAAAVAFCAKLKADGRACLVR